MRPARLLAVVVVTATPSFCFGWGRDGHKIVAEIASSRLDAKAQASVRALVGEAW